MKQKRIEKTRIFKEKPIYSILNTWKLLEVHTKKLLITKRKNY
jgi:hypothetical protein